MKKKIGIIGSGFSGICAALNLIDKKKFSLTIIDKSKIFGGVMHSSKVKDFYVDNGTHHFDAISKKLAKKIKDIMSKKVKKLPYRSASIFHGTMSKYYSYPDLTILTKTKKKKIYKEILALKNKDKILNFKNMEEFYLKCFGKTAGQIFIKLFKDIYGISPKKVEISFKDSSNLGRLKFLDDKKMKFLKKKYKLFDYALAAKRNGVRHNIDKPVESIYPVNKRGLRGWCEQTYTYLKKKGVNVINDFSIQNIYEKNKKIYISNGNELLDFDKLIWSNSSFEGLSEISNIKNKNFINPVPMVYYTFIIMKKYLNPKILYLHNFDKENIFFRAHNAGLLSEQEFKDKTFFTVECFTKINSKLWNDSEKYIQKIWSALIKYNFLYEKAKIKDFNIKKIKTSVVLPKEGKLEYDKRIITKLKKKYKNIIFQEKPFFFRREIFENMSKLSTKI